MAVHVSVTRRVRAGSEAEFQHAIRQLFAASLAEDGVLGTHLIEPADPSSHEFGILRSFVDAKARDRFYASPLYHEWEERVAPWTEGDPVRRELHGLEAWFRTQARPPRWKMALATLVGVYPTSLLLGATLGRWTSGWPQVLGALAFGAAMVAILTWIAMPIVTRLLHGWLSANSEGRDPR